MGVMFFFWGGGEGGKLGARDFSLDRDDNDVFLIGEILACQVRIVRGASLEPWG